MCVGLRRVVCCVVERGVSVAHFMLFSYETRFGLWIWLWLVYDYCVGVVCDCVSEWVYTIKAAHDTAERNTVLFGSVESNRIVLFNWKGTASNPIRSDPIHSIAQHPPTRAINNGRYIVLNGMTPGAAIESWEHLPDIPELLNTRQDHYRTIIFCDQKECFAS